MKQNCVKDTKIMEVKQYTQSISTNCGEFNIEDTYPEKIIRTITNRKVNRVFRINEAVFIQPQSSLSLEDIYFTKPF